VLTQKLLAHILTFLTFTFLLTIKMITVTKFYQNIWMYKHIANIHSFIILAHLCSLWLKPTRSQAVARIAERSASQQAI